MGFTKITNVSLTERFVQQIENMILSGELAVGEKLPSARDLCIKMGISRPVVSAGLIELEKLGFVEVLPRKGAFVCDYRRKGTVETLLAIMRYNGGAMRRNEVVSLLQVRQSLEILCMEQVILHASDRELEAFSPFLDRIARADDPVKTAEAVFAFHHELAVLSGNMLLPLLYHSFRTESLYLWTICGKHFGCRQLYETKLSLYQALLNRDTVAANLITARSIQTALEQLSMFIS
ncbi:MAG: FadR family transcriptional regulator [Oscillospiraceae bacterium]|nr:FadR family transcriptional regulator [Oscillospiraceae bacterium]MBR2423344.1 FadR family transcriptional regulator [Oscillospiraceae bacterium]